MEKKTYKQPKAKLLTVAVDILCTSGKKEEEQGNSGGIITPEI